ncbi:MAG: hypothetical protein ACRDYE_04330, partial [Acidimicrobiales bacterium]
MVEESEVRPTRPWTMSRRQLLGGGLMGAAGLAVGATASPAVTGADSTEVVTRPLALTVDGLAVPIGLAATDVYFAWQVGDSRRGARQSAYRILVSGPTAGPSAAPTVWDTGRVSSSEQAFVAYEGPRLASDSAYRWSVQAWDGAGQPGPRSLPSMFETGLGDHDWRASWIGRQASETAEPDQYTYARREVTLRHGYIVRARAFVSGDQQYELYVNGVRAGKGQAYSYPDSMY